MERATIDFGIDLGTTNSAIAVLRGTIPEIIKNNDSNDITPSAVYFGKNGRQYVGLRGKSQLEQESSANDVYVEFKRRMGTDYRYEFKTANLNMRPEELSAEVLKSLKADVQQKTGETIDASVITVPAAFELNQCNATKKAGELAGLALCPLLQEPVAAALAYGFQSEVAKEYWLVYDFGGGTFDAAVMKAEDGSISVVNHGGDNFLGGADIDWAIFDHLVKDKIVANYNLPDFKRGNKRWRTALAILKRSIENAKICLSRSESAFLDDCRFADEDGKVVDIDIKLMRNDVVGVAEPIIMRSIDICKRVLKEKNLSPSAIEKIILVGGPTLAPYFREILKDKIGIPLDFSVDPLTVVAKGAAVFAGTQRLNKKTIAKVQVGEFRIGIVSKAVGPEEDPTVRGTVVSENGASLDGFTIEVSNQLTHWKSGKVPVGAGGNFKLNLLAQKGERNIFTIELFDAKGNRQVVVHEPLIYTIGTTNSEQPIINSVGVALANNENELFFKKGEPLPAKHMKIFKVVHGLKKGDSGEVIKVPVVEGENVLGDRNRLLGYLEIAAHKIRRDVLPGSDIEVTLIMDASRSVTVKAYLSALDEEFEAKLEYDGASPDPTILQKDLEDEKNRLKELEKKEGEDSEAKSESALGASSKARLVDHIEEQLEAAEDDAVAAKQAEKLILELKVQLDKEEEYRKWPALVKAVHEGLEELDKLIESYEAKEYQAKVDQIRGEVEQLIEQHLADRLKKKLEQIEDLSREIYTQQPAFWVGFFKNVCEQQGKMTDQDGASKLINHGQQCIQKGNLEGLKQVVIGLMNLLPREAAADMERKGYGSGLLK